MIKAGKPPEESVFPVWCHHPFVKSHLILIGCVLTRLYVTVSTILWQNIVRYGAAAGCKVALLPNGFINEEVEIFFAVCPEWASELASILDSWGLGWTFWGNRRVKYSSFPLQPPDPISAPWDCRGGVCAHSPVTSVRAIGGDYKSSADCAWRVIVQPQKRGSSPGPRMTSFLKYPHVRQSGFFFFHHVYQMETLEILLEGSSVTEHHVGFLLISTTKEQHGTFQMLCGATIRRKAATWWE